jgi:organic radical activating enzyme
MYYVKDIFYTIQGEGHNVGTPSVFIRFSGCNLWSGREETRHRDSERSGAECPTWCDTDFFNGTKHSLQGIEDKLLSFPESVPLVVLTGGEPALQADPPLCNLLRKIFSKARIAIETNGTVAFHRDACFDWVCVSPKVKEDDLVIREGDEIKVVYPAYNPDSYSSIACSGFSHRYVSPLHPEGLRDSSLLLKNNIIKCVDYVKKNPEWRISLQTHKSIGVP